MTWIRANLNVGYRTRQDRTLAFTKTLQCALISSIICRYDVLSETWKASVMNTKSFGGQCRTIYSGVHQNLYRLPLSTLQYSFLVRPLELLFHCRIVALISLLEL